MDEYTEALPFHGKLKVKKDYWEIEYYFPGPDRRHNGELRRIPGTSIDWYIDAFTKAWAEYEALQSALPTGGEFSKLLPTGLTVRVGGALPGVCLHPYRMVISERGELDTLLASYQAAKAKAAQIQAVLFT